MEERLLQILADTQSGAAVTRAKAESDIKQLQTDEAFPTNLVTIAAHGTVAQELRLAALVVLRQFVEKNWSEEDFEGALIFISDSTREYVRTNLLGLATSDDGDRKIKNSASWVVSKIASVDFPDNWPTLLPTLLQLIPQATDNQLQGALKVLGDLVDDSLNDEQFFAVARDIVRVVYDVAVNEVRKTTLRALAVSVFRGCFDIMEMVKDEHGAEVKVFADEILRGWMPFFFEVMKTSLPALPSSTDETTGREPETWKGLISLKLQVVKTFARLRVVFPQLLAPQSPALFSATWAELTTLLPSYTDMYIDSDEQSRLVDADGLPYTLDFLVLEELDFFQTCLRAPPVQKELSSGFVNEADMQFAPWIVDIIKLATAYAQIPSEEEGLWDIDVNLFLAEETSVTSNFTARTACGDLVIKLGEWISQGTLEGLLTYTTQVFNSPESSWRLKEASLYLMTQLMNDYHDIEKSVPPKVSELFARPTYDAMIAEDAPFLRARGYLVAGVVNQSVADAAYPAEALLLKTIEAINADESQAVKVSCIKAAQGYLNGACGAATKDHQIPIIQALSTFLHTQDLDELEDSEDLLVTLVETLKAAISINPSVTTAPESAVIDLLFTLAKYGAWSFQMTMLVNETIEEIAQALSDQGGDAYTKLCEKILPALMGALDVGIMTENNRLTVLATELLSILTENANEPLPPGYVAATMPKLTRILLTTEEGDILRPGVEAVKYMLMQDHQQMFAWHDDTGKSGLEVCLVIVDRLLGPSVEDNSASEVGGLAAEIVEKAGQDRLGPFLPQLLQAVATRLFTAEAAQFIQSLILVFARLSLVGAQDVVNFLAQIEVGGQSGLQVVMSKWLEYSVSFAGYDAIRQNVIALSKLYSLNDSRLSQTMVKGNLIVPKSDKIMTRSRTKKNPDQYTIIPAQLKIVKVLLEDLLAASGMPNEAAAAAAAADFADEEDDDGWEDVPNTLDLGLGTTKEQLMAFGDGTGSLMRQRDDETQAFLSEFFLRVSRENVAGFTDWFPMLTDEEKMKLNELVVA